MEENSFKHYVEQYIKVTNNVAELTRELKGKPVVETAHLKKQLLLQKNRAKWLELKMENFGRGKVIEITGTVSTPIHKNSSFTKTEKFKLLLVNITQEDAGEFLKTIVKIKYKNINEETILIKQLPVGILQIS